MTDVKKEEFGIDVVEDISPLYKVGLFFLKSNKNYRIYVGSYKDLLKLHRQLNDAIYYNFVNNKSSKLSISHNSRYFYIKNKIYNTQMGMPVEYAAILLDKISKIVSEKSKQYYFSDKPKSTKTKKI